MPLHCIFVMTGFDLNAKKGFKNLLKMNLEKCYRKRKAKSFFLLFSSFSACWPSSPPAR
jgi:hypothetical protein